MKWPCFLFIYGDNTTNWTWSTPKLGGHGQELGRELVSESMCESVSEADTDSDTDKVKTLDTKVLISDTRVRPALAHAMDSTVKCHLETSSINLVRGASEHYL